MTCFGLLIADFVFTIQQQTPINQYIQTLDFNNLTPEQLSKFQDLREQNNKNFGIRDYFQWSMFFLMSITPYLLPKLEKRLSENQK